MTVVRRKISWPGPGFLPRRAFSSAKDFPDGSSGELARVGLRSGSCQSFRPDDTLQSSSSRPYGRQNRADSTDKTSERAAAIGRGLTCVAPDNLDTDTLPRKEQHGCP